MAGHHRSGILCPLMTNECTYRAAVETLRACLDPGRQALAVQYFRHTMQQEAETVASYIIKTEGISNRLWA